MEEQLKLLEELQQLDLKLHETQEALAALPKKLQSMKDDVAQVEQMLDNERKSLSEAESYKAELEGDLKEEQDLLHKTKTKLAAVRTSKEYLAVQREFESNRRTTGDREEEVAKLNAAIEQFQKSIAVHEEELAALQEHVAQEEDVTKGQIAELKSAEESQMGTRNEIATTVQKGVLRKYDSIARRRHGMAVVPAVRGVCSGCNMKLPPQLYNIIQREASIEQCPNCQRIIYYVPPEPAE